MFSGSIYVQRYMSVTSLSDDNVFPSVSSLRSKFLLLKSKRWPKKMAAVWFPSYKSLITFKNWGFTGTFFQSVKYIPGVDQPF